MFAFCVLLLLFDQTFCFIPREKIQTWKLEKNDEGIFPSQDSGQNRFKRAIQLTESIANYASRMETAHGISRPTASASNSIYQYTVRSATNAAGKKVTLPLVVRASITPDKIQPKNSRGSDAVSSAAKTNCKHMGMNKNLPNGNNDEYGHLIAYKNGGPPDVYNIVPQTTRVNIGTTTVTDLIAQSLWALTEKWVTEFVENTKGRVEMIVTVYYDGAETRPAAFGVSEIGYDTAGKEVHRRKDYYYSNNPVGDPDAINMNLAYNRN